MARAKINITNLKAAKTALRKRITVAARDKALRTEIGDIIIEDIKKANFGLPALTTFVWRKRYEKLNKTDRQYGIHKINATFTGELLNDLARNVKVETTKGKITYVIEHTDKLHKKYTGVKKKIGSRSKYSDISKGIVGHGYDYFKLQPETLNKILKTFRKRISEKLNK